MHRLTPRRSELAYLAKQRSPIWGGHLQRGQPLNDPQIRQWLDLGLIEQVEGGYVITHTGRAALAQSEDASRKRGE